MSALPASAGIWRTDDEVLETDGALQMNSSHRHEGNPSPNFLLGAFPAADRSRWEERLESVTLAAGTALCEAGEVPVYLYFPTTAIVSSLSVTSGGASAEIAVVGHEGLIGMSLLTGSAGETNRSVVQGAGDAYRVHADEIRTRLKPDGAVLDILLGYSQSLFAQAAQTAVCNRYHSIEQQLCRRLLMALDRSASNELAMTHELAANLLGVRREGVSVAALKLQRDGVISYSRGRVLVRDRGQLERRACECYPPAKGEYLRLRPAASSAPSRCASDGGTPPETGRMARLAAPT